ncbi:DUF718 domain-containing protein [Aestuariivirga sp.]|uniref:DUF718 domain-containing protein n=1 Tax=Aestuariivirga sp. TaxID=2650926 RepID=UPI0035932CE1
MTAYNAVRFRVKPGMEMAFEDAHRIEPEFKGFKGGALVKTGDRSYCFIGSWDSADTLAAGRPKMLPLLDSMRHMLEDLGDGLGVTDPVSGTAVVEFPASRA